MSNPLHFYRVKDDHGELSNFAPSPIHLKDRLWPTVEHYFQAQKFAGTEYEEQVRLTHSPMIAARMGRSRSRPLRPDWEQAKEDVMREALRAKFTQHPHLRDLLVATGKRPLIEHTRNDRYWADGGDGRGRNRLGVLLMELRAELRSEVPLLIATAQPLLEKPAVSLPLDHVARLVRARASLDGLSTGDAFGECFFGNYNVVQRRIEAREMPPSPWTYTDDTAMALSVYACLSECGEIDRDRLAELFAEEYDREPNRGYGGTARSILRAIRDGVAWQAAAGQAFSGMGSIGNGGGMRAAPLGAYFADDVDELVCQARYSAEVTHAHPEGQAGAIGIALAAAWAWNHRDAQEKVDPQEIIKFVVDGTPQGDTQSRLRRALDIPFEREPEIAAQMLGNGTKLSAPDTVPFAVWCAARHCWDFSEALWATASGGGDVDTTCAMVGGIVALSAGAESIPVDWLRARGNLPVE